MSWEDEDWESKDIAIVKETSSSSTSKWDDEDKEVEEKDGNIPKPAARNPEKKKPIGKKVEEKEQQSKSGTVSSSTSENLSEKQKHLLAKESDYHNATGLFSGLENAIDINNPKDERDFEVLATTLSDKLAVYDKNPNFKTFIRTLVRGASKSLKADDLKDLSTAFSVMANEKLKEEKDKPKKKGSVKQKVALNVKQKDAFEGLEAADNDEDDEDGFM